MRKTGGCWIWLRQLVVTSLANHMNKKVLTEADIRTKFITPAILGARGEKWDVMTQVREEIYFTKGRVIVRGKTVTRGEAKKADYLLYYKPNIPIAVVEAKDNNSAVGAGMQQALEYAEILDIPFAYSSNGDAFLEHDRTGVNGVVEREIPLDQFPTPEELWERYRQAKGYSPAQETIASQDTTTTAPARRRVTTSSTRSTARSMPLPGARTEFFWSWRPERARPTRRSRSFGDFGNREPRNGSCSLWIATSSPTRPRPTTSSPSVRR